MAHLKYWPEIEVTLTFLDESGNKISQEQWIKLKNEKLSKQQKQSA